MIWDFFQIHYIRYSSQKNTIRALKGGITYGEIAALRRLSQLEEGRRRHQQTYAKRGRGWVISSPGTSR